MINMKTYAIIVSNKVAEIVNISDEFNIADMYHTDIKTMECSQQVQPNWVLQDGILVAPNDVSILYAKIDEAAGKARARYITVAPGQEGTYILKAQHAEQYKAANYTGIVPLMVESEATATGLTPKEATDAILMQYTAWIVKAAEIEGCRRKWKVACQAIDAVPDTIITQALAELSQI